MQSFFVSLLYSLFPVDRLPSVNALVNTSLVVGYFTGIFMTAKSFLNFKDQQMRLEEAAAADNSKNILEQEVYDSPLNIDSREFDYVSSKLREFFKGKGFIETHTQNRLSILAACEDPWTVTSYHYANNIWPLPQTGQMWLEYEMLKDPSAPGYFCCSTSYRQEPDPIPGRHDLIFPMFEFEMHGNMEALIALEKELLEHLGYSPEGFAEGEYTAVAEKYKTESVEHVHETNLYKEYGPCYFLTNFPESTSPFWNMKRNSETGKANKVDVILSGQETIGSAERESCPIVMRDRFNTISEGKYKQKLYDLFGKERTDCELNRYLKMDFFERSGAGIGMTRLIRSMKMEGLMERSQDNAEKDPGTSICI